MKHRIASRLGGPLEASQLRVAVVTSSLWPGANEVWRAAGAQIQDLLLVGAASADVMADSASDPAVARLREADFGRGLVWRHLAGLRKTIRAYNPDILHVNGELWSLTVQEVLGLRTKVVVHGAENVWHHGGKIESKLRDRLVRRALRHSVGYASWNHDGRDHVAELTPPKFPTLVMPAIIPPDLFRRFHWNGAAAASRQEFEILLVGRIIALKGFDTVIRAVAQVDSRERIIITVCGEGPEADTLKRLAASHNVSISMLGSVGPRQLAELMSAASCVVQPSISTPACVEQFGRSVAEAMMVGVPVIVSDSGELQNLVGRDPEAVFREADADALARRLAPLVGDPSRLSQLAERQRALTRRYLPDAAGAQVVKFWHAASTFPCGNGDHE